jgi:hypothetical protein
MATAAVALFALLLANTRAASSWCKETYPEAMQDWCNKLGPKVTKPTSDCARRGQPRIGMTKAQAVVTCWGYPRSVNTTETANGLQEQYIYGGARYLYFTNGVLDAIQR